MRKGWKASFVWLDKAIPANTIDPMQSGIAKMRTHNARYLDVMISKAGNEAGRLLFKRIGSFWFISAIFLARTILGKKARQPDALSSFVRKRVYYSRRRAGKHCEQL